MHPTRIFAILLRVFYLMRGSFTRIVSPVVWPALDIVLWGFIARYLNSVSMSTVGFITLFLGAGLFWEFFNRSMFGVTMTFMEDVWSRNFLNVFSTPIRISEYLVGLILAGTVVLALSMTIMLVLTTLLFGL